VKFTTSLFLSLFSQKVTGTVAHVNTTAKRMKTIKFKYFHKLPTHNRSEEIWFAPGWKEDLC
jgi:hypothetical protein